MRPSTKPGDFKPPPICRISDWCPTVIQPLVLVAGVDGQPRSLALNDLSTNGTGVDAHPLVTSCLQALGDSALAF